MSQAESVMANVPEHVPAERVRDFDIYSPTEGQRDMMGSVASVVADAPKIFFTARNGGHWVIAGYDVLAAAARDTETFSSFPYTIPTYADEQPLAPLLVDPPLHSAHRVVLNRMFTPKRAVALASEIRGSAVTLIEAAAGLGRCDFVKSISELLPVSVFLRLFGLPHERLHEYRHAIKTYLGSADVEDKRKMADWIINELSEAIRDHQRNPREDLISELIDAEIEGRKASFEETLNFCMMLFAAGLDTVTVSLSYGVRHLAEDANLQTWARANPNKVQELTEEMLRRYSAAQPGRTVTRDVVMDNVTLKKGDRVLLLVAGANLDPDAFDSPLAVIPGRPKTPHLAFNVGPHRCVGMHLARVELQIAYEEWLARIPAFRLDPDCASSSSGGHVLSLNSLGLRWD